MNLEFLEIIRVTCYFEYFFIWEIQDVEFCASTRIVQIDSSYSATTTCEDQSLTFVDPFYFPNIYSEEIHGCSIFHPWSLQECCCGREKGHGITTNIMATSTANVYSWLCFHISFIGLLKLDSQKALHNPLSSIVLGHGSNENSAWHRYLKYYLIVA
jgi:hypothetical protein